VKYGGLKFLEAAHVKDLLSVLRWVQNPRSRLAGFRVAQLIPGLGPVSVRRLLDAMDGAPDPVEAMRAYKPPPAAAPDWRAWLDVHAALQSGAWPDDVAVASRWYQPHLERLHDDAVVRQADLAQLARIAAGYGSRERFLAELTLDPPDATSDESAEVHLDEDYLILSTLHSAKGQEWCAVHVLNVVDGCIPSDMATGHAAEIEEERRLLYVAMTRAKHRLSLMVPQRFYVTQQRQHGDRHLYGGLSRFIPAEVAARFERIGPDSMERDDVAPPMSLPRIDVLARVRSGF
jgi:DNA helicase-2/ATP-dependent DNA helicase PcrA